MPCPYRAVSQRFHEKRIDRAQRICRRQSSAADGIFRSLQFQKYRLHSRSALRQHCLCRYPRRKMESQSESGGRPFCDRRPHACARTRALRRIHFDFHGGRLSRSGGRV